MSTEDNALAPSEIEATATAAEVENTAEQPEADKDQGNTEAEGAQPEAKEDGGDAEGDSPKKNRTSAKERIAELTRQKREAEKRAKEAETKLKAYEAPAPKRAEYTDADEYEAARAKWAAKAARGDEAKSEAESASAQASAAKVEAWNASKEDARSRHPDIDEVIAAVPPSIFNAAVADAILESEMAADVAYVLAKDLARAKEFAAMTPLQQGKEIGRIEAELAPKPRKISSAPPPVETLGTKGPGASPDPSKMSMAEYVKWRKSQDS